LYEESGRRAPQRLDQDAEFTDLIRQRLTGDLQHRRRLILISVRLQQRFFDELPAALEFRAIAHNDLVDRTDY